MNSVWKNYCINGTYEPGSVSKLFTVAAGLDSGALEGNEHYMCNGKLNIGGYSIKCHNTYGDGEISIKQAVAESCNVALMYMAFDLGKDQFLTYQELFNFGLKTNIVLAGETRTAALVHNYESMGETELATSSFGQGFNVTMIQEIAAFCSLINGGYYYEPHMVERIIAADGSTVENIAPRVLKQTISEGTSQKVIEYCNAVVTEGTGKTARPAGYAIGGKTGTAQTIPRGNGEYVVSFMGYAPADDPQIAVYVVVDRPNVGKQDDAKHATRIVRSVLTEVLPYLNIFMTEELSESEIAELEALDLEIIMEANQKDESVSDNDVSTEEQTGEQNTEGDKITDANGGDITSSISVSEDVGSTAPLTGVLLDKETGEAVQNQESDSPY